MGTERKERAGTNNRRAYLCQRTARPLHLRSFNTAAYRTPCLGAHGFGTGMRGARANHIALGACVASYAPFRTLIALTACLNTARNRCRYNVALSSLQIPCSGISGTAYHYGGHAYVSAFSHFLKTSWSISPLLNVTCIFHCAAFATNAFLSIG